jgi:hypothetical protein
MTGAEGRMDTRNRQVRIVFTTEIDLAMLEVEPKVHVEPRVPLVGFGAVESDPGPSRKPHVLTGDDVDIGI